jgi:hypothetical protein
MELGEKECLNGQQTHGGENCGHSTSYVASKGSVAGCRQPETLRSGPQICLESIILVNPITLMLRSRRDDQNILTPPFRLWADDARMHIIAICMPACGHFNRRLLLC